jgi:zinc D-Ala-D-Ala carboxypeptidase
MIRKPTGLLFLFAGAAFLATAVSAAKGRADHYGHRPYAEAPEKELTRAGNYRATGRVVLLREEAAAAFREMVEAAKRDGVGLVPISGFRTRAYQESLFLRSQKKHGSARAAARWVAPPGFSEHHTGYTLDVGDAGRPETDVDPAFEKTPAFKWLEKNAARFGFELSFPPDNPQGVSYEPWHWRYVGSPHARRVFRAE